MRGAGFDPCSVTVTPNTRAMELRGFWVVVAVWRDAGRWKLTLPSMTTRLPGTPFANRSGQSAIIQISVPSCLTVANTKLQLQNWLGACLPIKEKAHHSPVSVKPYTPKHWH